MIKSESKNSKIMGLDVQTGIEIGVALITALGIWYKDVIARKIGLKKDIESVEDSAIHNLEHNLKIYQVMVDDIDTRYKIRIKELEETFNSNLTQLNSELVRLKQINVELNEFITEQRMIINKQNKTLATYKKKYGIVEE